MRFSTIIVGAFAAAAAAADSSSVTTPTTTVASPSTSVSLDPAQATVLNCLKGCADGDVNCRAACLNVPFPNEGQANATNTCAAACPKGSGNDADVKAWGECVQACIGKNYWTSAGGTPQPTGGSGSGSGSSSGSGSTASATGGSVSGSSSTGSSSTATGSGASADQTNAPKNPADSVRVGTSAVGLVGFLAAFVLL